MSRLTLIRSRPASLSAPAVLASPSALVVSEVSGRGSRAAVRRTMSTSPRRTSGSPPVNRTSRTPEALHRDRDQPDHLVVAELRLQREPVQALLGHAVGAAQVAAVGQADAQVGGDPAEGVCEWLHSPSLGSGGWADGWVASRRALVRVPAEPALGRVRAGCGGAGVRHVVAGRVAVPPPGRPQGRERRRAHQRAPRGRPRGRRAEPGPRPVRAGRVAGGQRDRDLRRGADGRDPLPEPRRRAGGRRRRTAGHGRRHRAPRRPRLARDRPERRGPRRHPRPARRRGRRDRVRPGQRQRRQHPGRRPVRPLDQQRRDRPGDRAPGLRRLRGAAGRRTPSRRRPWSRWSCPS